MTQTQDTQAETCSTCPYFEDFNESDFRGWCHCFDQQARTHHTRTNDCDQQIQALEEKEAKVPASILVEAKEYAKSEGEQIVLLRDDKGKYHGVSALQWVMSDGLPGHQYILAVDPH